MARRAWELLDQADRAETLLAAGKLEEFGGACFALGMLLNDFASVSSGSSTGEPWILARDFYRHEVQLGKPPTADEVRAHVFEALAFFGKEFKTKQSSFATGFSNRKKLWDAEMAEKKI